MFDWRSVGASVRDATFVVSLGVLAGFLGYWVVRVGFWLVSGAW